MSFVLGSASKAKLVGVHPDLVKVVERAIQLSPVDFAVIEGLRTLARQQDLVRAGASKTMKSRHLTGHAVDLAAFVGGAIRWDWNLYTQIADAVKKASDELKIPVRWGGAWKLLSELKHPITSADLSKSFPDGPHFELPTKFYS